MKSEERPLNLTTSSSEISKREVPPRGPKTDHKGLKSKFHLRKHEQKVRTPHSRSFAVKEIRQRMREIMRGWPRFGGGGSFCF